MLLTRWKLLAEMSAELPDSRELGEAQTSLHPAASEAGLEGCADFGPRFLHLPGMLPAGTR